MKKNNSIKIYCTSEQKEKIQQEAEKIGKTLQEFCLSILLNTSIEIKISSR